MGGALTFRQQEQPAPLSRILRQAKDNKSTDRLRSVHQQQVAFSCSTPQTSVVVILLNRILSDVR